MKLELKFLLIVVILQVKFLSAQIEVLRITAANVADNKEAIGEAWQLYCSVHDGMLPEWMMELQFNAAICDVELGNAFLAIARIDEVSVVSIFCNNSSEDFFPMITLGVFGFNDQQFDNAMIDRAFSRILNNLPNDGFSCGVCLNVTSSFVDKYQARLSNLNFAKDNLIYSIAPYAGSFWYSLMWENFPRL